MLFSLLVILLHLLISREQLELTTAFELTLSSKLPGSLDTARGALEMPQHISPEVDIRKNLATASTTGKFLQEKVLPILGIIVGMIVGMLHAPVGMIIGIVHTPLLALHQKLLAVLLIVILAITWMGLVPFLHVIGMVHTPLLP